MPKPMNADQRSFKTALGADGIAAGRFDGRYIGVTARDAARKAVRQAFLSGADRGVGSSTSAARPCQWIGTTMLLRRRSRRSKAADVDLN